MQTSDDIIRVAKKICKQENLILDENKQGGGSFKKVFKVTNDSLPPFALKVIKSTIRSPRTIREISAIQKCNHPNIAKIFKFDSIEFNNKNYEYIIEEYLGGGSLSECLEQNNCLKQSEVIVLGEKLISTLEHLYERKLVHRDIKPDNIMFRESTIDPVLIDFSIVRDLAESSLTQSWIGKGPGTPMFSAPEQLNNQKRLIDWRTDQFSLGVVLALTIMNFHPYQSNNSPMLSNETVENITNRKRNKDFSEKCKRNNLVCIERMTRPWPVERYRLPNDLINAWNNQETK